jgi:hypothetical protein
MDVFVRSNEKKNKILSTVAAIDENLKKIEASKSLISFPLGL